MLDSVLKTEIERDFVPRLPKRPTKLAEFTVAQLPPAEKWAWCTVAVVDLDCVGLSNGMAWLRPDGTTI